MGHELSSDDRMDSAIAFPRLYDWAIGALLALGGLLSGLAGAVLYTSIDEGDVDRLVRGVDIQFDPLARTEVIDSLVVLGEWIGIGLVAAGVLIAVTGIAVVVVHSRARSAGQRTPRWILGVMGAVVGVVLGFVPFSPAVGGAAAGYFDPDRDASGLGSGTLAGLFATGPLLVVATFAAVGLFVDLPGKTAAPGAILLGIGVLVSGVYLIGLSAIGGVLGARLDDG